MSRGDTIAAVATAPGRGGVAIVRVSGPEAFALAERLTGRAPKPRQASLESIRVKLESNRVDLEANRVDLGSDPQPDPDPTRPYSTLIDPTPTLPDPKSTLPDPKSTLIDFALVLAFKGPHSYTGEDVVEFQCHGGTVVPRRVLEACLASGARLARRGEFTERAFLNGRLSYEEAESVLDLVDAKTDRAADAALEGLAGTRRRALRALYDALVELSSTAEHALDVSEEELPDGFAADLESSAASIAARLDDAIRRAREGKILREGALVVIAGPPNAGKSSLLNALLGEDRAIVSATPGTTRDSIEEWLDVEGWPVRLVDTAGLRDTSDAIEGEGVARARNLMEKADLVLNLTPADANRSSLAARRPSPAARIIEILSKSDLRHAPRDTGALAVSAKTGEGIDALRGAIAAHLARRAAAPDGGGAALDGDVAALVEARARLSSTPPLPHSPTPAPAPPLPDLVLFANRVRAAAERLGEALGAVYSADLLDALFSRFCVGK